jgi:hypothetical protein
MITRFDLFHVSDDGLRAAVSCVTLSVFNTLSDDMLQPLRPVLKVACVI